MSISTLSLITVDRLARRHGLKILMSTTRYSRGIAASVSLPPGQQTYDTPRVVRWWYSAKWTGDIGIYARFAAKRSSHKRQLLSFLIGCKENAKI
jgi:hypothetical protein